MVSQCRIAPTHGAQSPRKIPEHRLRLAQLRDFANAPPSIPPSFPPPLAGAAEVITSAFLGPELGPSHFAFRFFPTAATTFLTFVF